jgi:integrase
MKEKIGFRLLLVESKKTAEGYTILVTYKSTRKTTPFRTQKSYWNDRKRRLNTNAPMALFINAELDKMQQEYETALSEFEHPNPTIHDLYNYVIEKQKTKKKDKIDNQKVIVPKVENKTGIVTDYIETYKVTFKNILSSEYLRSFNQIKLALNEFRPKVQFSEFDPQFWYKYKNFLVTEKEVLDSTISNHLKRLKELLKFYQSEGNKISYEFLKLKQSENTAERFALTLPQVYAFSQVEVKEPYMVLSRDLFVLQCTSGLRIKELLTLRPENIVKLNSIVIHQRKSKKNNEIPLNKISRAIIQKYLEKNPVAQLFEPIAGQTLNEKIKIIGQMAGINDIRTVTHWSGSNMIEVKKPLYALLTTHIARHTYGTLIYKKSKDEKLTKRALGKGSKTEDVYIHFDEEEYTMIRSAFE